MTNGNGTTESRLRVARPTLAVDGQDNSSLGEGLISLCVIEQTAGLYRCEAQIGNWGPVDGKIGFLYFDRRVLDFGKSFAVKIGSDVLFDGRITALEAHFPEGGPPEIVVLAEDRFQDLRMVRRTRSFENVSDADVFQQIASDHGLSPQVSLSGPTYGVLAQVNQSDLAFLRERARTVDAELWMDGSTLYAKGHTSRGGTSVELSYGGDLRSFVVTADLAGQRTSVTASGWDVGSKSALKYEADEAALSAELNGDQSGAKALRTAFGERKEALAHTVPLTSQEAQAVAESYFKLNGRRFLVGRGVAEASAKLRVGAKVDLKGLGPLFSGKYYLTETRLLFDGDAGLRVEFIADRPGLGRA